MCGIAILFFTVIRHFKHILDFKAVARMKHDMLVNLSYNKTKRNYAYQQNQKRL